MKLVSWNVNGLRAALSKGLLNWLISTKIDIFCIQEAKISCDLMHLVEPLNQLCSSYYYSYALKRGYSGVATYELPRDLFTSTTLSHGTIQLGCQTCDNEGRVVITQDPKFTLYNIYFPSGSSGNSRQNIKYNFLDLVYNHLSSLSKQERDKTIICGDFNVCHKEIDIHNPIEAHKKMLSGFLPDERKWMDKFIELGYIDTFRALYPDTKNAYTWWSYRVDARRRNLGWRIDYFFVSSAMASRVKNADIYMDVMGSDHCPILLEIDL